MGKQSFLLATRVQRLASVQSAMASRRDGQQVQCHLTLLPMPFKPHSHTSPHFTGKQEDCRSVGTRAAGAWQHLIRQAEHAGSTPHGLVLIWLLARRIPPDAAGKTAGQHWEPAVLPEFAPGKCTGCEPTGEQLP